MALATTATLTQQHAASNNVLCIIMQTCICNVVNSVILILPGYTVQSPFIFTSFIFALHTLCGRDEMQWFPSLQSSQPASGDYSQSMTGHTTVHHLSDQFQILACLLHTLHEFPFMLLPLCVLSLSYSSTTDYLYLTV